MKLTNFRLFISFLLVFLSPIIILFNVVYIQVWNHTKYKQLAIKQISEKVIKCSARGLIYDRNMEVLAMNVNSFSLAANPRVVLDPAEFAKKITKHINIPESMIANKIVSKRECSFVWLKRKIFIKDISPLQKMEDEGLIILPETRRYYPLGAVASKLVGVAGVDGEGLSAIEKFHDKFAMLKNTIESYKKLGKNRKVKISPESPENPVNIITTIDSKLQYISANEIEEAVKKYNAKNGFVIVQDPSSGEILALASSPSFDPNDDLSFSREDLKIQGFQEVFEPGSTFKLIIAGAALSEGLFDTNDIIYCENGSYKYTDIEINDHVKHGYLTFDGVFTYSSNIGFAKVGLALGRDRLYRWVRHFGFGSYTGLNLAGEQKGLLFSPDSKKWNLATCPTISYGQGIGVTALQIINAYSAVANGGTLYETNIIKKIINDKDNEIAHFSPRKIRNVLSPVVISKLKNMLNNVVEYGTGKQARVSGYKVCGKTGTAQKVETASGKYGDRYIASFCGFLPMDAPKITILVVIDEPKAGYWASDVACPVFSKIAAQSMNYLSIPKCLESYEFTKLPR